MEILAALISTVAVYCICIDDMEQRFFVHVTKIESCQSKAHLKIDVSTAYKKKADKLGTNHETKSLLK